MMPRWLLLYLVYLLARRTRLSGTPTFYGCGEGPQVEHAIEKKVPKCMREEGAHHPNHGRLLAAPKPRFGPGFSDLCDDACSVLVWCYGVCVGYG